MIRHCLQSGRHKRITDTGACLNDSGNNSSAFFPEYGCNRSHDNTETQTCGAKGQYQTKKEQHGKSVSAQRCYHQPQHSEEDTEQEDKGI